MKEKRKKKNAFYVTELLTELPRKKNRPKFKIKKVCVRAQN